VYPRPPQDWCLLFVTLDGQHGYPNQVRENRLEMGGKDEDREVNAWLLGAGNTQRRVGLMLRNHEGEPFTYRGEVTLLRGDANPAWFVWQLPH
jgi:hypothetical protein